jgi:hypothetical protein
MPNSPFKSQASETPYLRAKIQLADGRIEQITCSSTIRIDPALADSPEYKAAATRAVEAFLAASGFGTRLVRLEVIRSVSLELGK